MKLDNNEEDIGSNHCFFILFFSWLLRLTVLLSFSWHPSLDVLLGHFHALWQELIKEFVNVLELLFLKLLSHGPIDKIQLCLRGPLVFHSEA